MAHTAIIVKLKGPSGSLQALQREWLDSFLATPFLSTDGRQGPSPLHSRVYAGTQGEEVLKANACTGDFAVEYSATSANICVPLRGQRHIAFSLCLLSPPVRGLQYHAVLVAARKRRLRPIFAVLLLHVQRPDLSVLGLLVRRRTRNVSRSHICQHSLPRLREQKSSSSYRARHRKQKSFPHRLWVSFLAKLTILQEHTIFMRTGNVVLFPPHTEHMPLNISSKEKNLGAMMLRRDPTFKITCSALIERQRTEYCI